MYVAGISDYLFDSFLLKNNILLGVEFLSMDQNKADCIDYRKVNS